ncbi:MAG: hypothetical protein HYT72_02880 [Candidatus Aenigmarchaeota archaeon]|nr:hypothetical protein [Candidatus Aenigmarchaeota archaeon]
MAKKKAAVKYRCMRCKKEYNSWRGLQRHSAVHLKKGGAYEIQQLKEGKIPDVTKIGAEFKGKNKIIIS